MKAGFVSMPTHPRGKDRRIAILGGDAGRSHPLAPLDEVRSAGFSASLISPRLKVFPHTPYERGLAVIAYLEAAIAAERAGYDAVMINTLGDYGIDEMKSALRIPVVGAGESTIALTANVGRRFSVVILWPPKMNFIVEERLRASGAVSRCVSIRNVLGNHDIIGTSDAISAMAGLQAPSASTVLERVVEQAFRAVRDDGADTIVLGCTCMAPIASLVASRVPVPVLDPMCTGYTVAETLLKLRLRQSEVAYPQANLPIVSKLESMVDAIAGIELGAECEVCVLGQRSQDCAS
jgi:allantoin racemase